MKNLIKSLLLIALIALIASPGWGATKPVVTDYLPYAFTSADDTYVYGVTSRTPSTTASAVRLLSTSGTVSNGFDFDGKATVSGSGIWQCAYLVSTNIDTGSGKLVFAVVRDSGSGYYYLLKSIDSAVSFGTPSSDYLIKLGTGTLQGGVLGSNSIAIRSEGSGNYTMILVEYMGDDIDNRILKSTGTAATLGNTATWTTVGTWNGDIKHFHSVFLNPYNNDFYITTGDLDAESGIIRWNGTSAITQDKDFTWYVANLTNYATDGYSVIGGAQRYRTCQILFDANYMYWISDTCASADERGIWRASHDFSGVSRVGGNSGDDVADYFADNHSGFSGVKTSSGEMIFTEILEENFADGRARVFASDNGSSWKTVAYYGYRTIADTVLKPCGFFEFNNKIYLSGSDSAKTDTSQGTAEFYLSGSFDYGIDIEPIIIHPVFWVSTTGNDTGATRGYRPSIPYLTLQNAMLGDKLTPGSRVIIGAGAFAEVGIFPDWDANPRPQTVGSVVIEGQGRSSTSVYRNSTNDYLFYLESPEAPAAYPLTFKNLTLYNKLDSAGAFVVKLTATTGVRFIDSTVGTTDADNAPASTIRLYSTNSIVTGIRSRICHRNSGTVANTYTITADNTGNTMNFYQCIFDGGDYQVTHHRSGGNLTEYNCTHVNYRSAGVYYTNTANEPTIKNCIFGPALAEGTPYSINENSNAITETKIDYNYYAVATRYVTDGGHSKTGTDPLFVSATDLRLKAGSPCINKGDNSVWASSPNVFSYNNVRITDGSNNIVAPGGTVDIGAYEYVGGPLYLQWINTLNQHLNMFRH